MTENILELRSEMAQMADDEEPDTPHCARCGKPSLVATLMVVPLATPVGEAGYTATLCDTCANRVMDLLVNPHLLVTAQTTNPLTQAAEVMVDGASFTRADAVEILHHAANMLDTGEPEVVARYDNPSPDEDIT